MQPKQRPPKQKIPPEFTAWMLKGIRELREEATQRQGPAQAREQAEKALQGSMVAGKQ